MHWLHPKLAQYIPKSPYALGFLITTIIESSLDIILESILIDRLKLIPHDLKILNNDSQTASITPLAVYLGIFILAHLFQLYVAVDALRHKNTIQLIGLCSFNFCFLVYAIIQVPEIHEIESNFANKNTSGISIYRVILMIIPVCIGISQIVFVFLTWHLFKEFGWQIYRQIGADRKIKRFYLIYQIFMCLLKFDYFFFIGFSIQLVLLVPSVAPVEKGLTILALPLTLLLLVSGYYGVRRENKPLVSAFMFGLLSGSSYFIYKLFRIWNGRHDEKKYKNVFKSLTLFSISCLLMTLLTFTTAAICLKNFGQGLKVHIDKKSVRKKGGGGGVSRLRLGGGQQRADGVDVGGQPRRTYPDPGRTGGGKNLSTMLSISKHDGRREMESDSESQNLDTFKTNELCSYDDPLGAYDLSPHHPLSLNPTPQFTIQDDASHDRYQPHPPTSHPNYLNPQRQSAADSQKRMSID